MLVRDGVDINFEIVACRKLGSPPAIHMVSRASARRLHTATSLSAPRYLDLIWRSLVELTVIICVLGIIIITQRRLVHYFQMLIEVSVVWLQLLSTWSLISAIFVIVVLLDDAISRLTGQLILGL